MIKFKRDAPHIASPAGHHPEESIVVGHAAKACKQPGRAARALPMRRIPSRLQPWACRLCTLENEGSAARCEACRSSRTSGGLLSVLYILSRCHSLQVIEDTIARRQCDVLGYQHLLGPTVTLRLCARYFALL